MLKTTMNRGTPIAVSFFSLLALVILCCQPALAAEVELRNDSFETGQVAGFQGGFVAGEIGAARFVPPGACRVTKIKLLFGGSTSTKTVTFHVWQDPTGANAPGPEIVEPFDADMTGSNLAWQEIALVDPITVLVDAPFRIGLEFQHDGYPNIARDNDGAAYPDRSFIYAQGLGWQRAKTLGVNGDWIIRAIANCGGAAPDAGPHPDAARPDAGLPADAAPPVVDARPAGKEAGTVDGGGGRTCKSNPDCPEGQYCASDGICSYDCLKDSDCRSGHCNSLGKCVEDGGGCRVGGGTTPARPGLLASLGLLLLLSVGGTVVWHRRRGTGWSRQR